MGHFLLIRQGQSQANAACGLFTPNRRAFILGEPWNPANLACVWPCNLCSSLRTIFANCCGIIFVGKCPSVTVIVSSCFGVVPTCRLPAMPPCDALDHNRSLPARHQFPRSSTDDEFKDGAYYCYCAYVLRISRY